MIREVEAMLGRTISISLDDWAANSWQQAPASSRKSRVVSRGAWDMPIGPFAEELKVPVDSRNGPARARRRGRDDCGGSCHHGAYRFDARIMLAACPEC